MKKSNLEKDYIKKILSAVTIQKAKRIYILICYLLTQKP